MERRNMKREELEQKLRDYLRAEAADVEPAPEWWQRAFEDLGEQKPARRWPSLSGWSRVGWPGRVLAGAAGVAGVVGLISLMFLRPWAGAPEPEGAREMVGVEGRAGVPGPMGPRGAAPGNTLLMLDMPLGEAAGETTDRMIVYQSDLSLAVKGDVGEAMDGVARAATERGGFVVSSSRQGDDSASITVRVPSERFEETKQAVRSLGDRVLSESTRSQDVTEEYVDLQARVRNWEAAEEQYLELMTKAFSVEETLKVQERLVSVRGEIERIKGRMQYLERTSAMASITVELRPASDPAPVVPTGWDVGETGRSALRSLAALGQRLAGTGIWIAVYSPVWVVLGVVAFLVGRRVIRG